MKPTFIGLLFHKVRIFRGKIRIFLYKTRGLEIQRGSKLGKISCDWPNQLKIGHDCQIQDNTDFRLGHPFNDDCFIKIKDRVFIGHGCEFVCSTKITIGNDCKIASKTTINDSGHEYTKGLKINTQPITIGEVNIEEDVWIGTSCVILQGVTIGRGSIIGAGSVVNKSIPEYQVWAGIPARFIKNRN
jgi:acetyltransferase-like isoleucine patch superfamily enzyme